ncbi:MAG: type II secretion system protein [Oscillospiraceae bacterium]|nr:type II secretion system protein [Oscillospiraceae bacterium]
MKKTLKGFTLIELIVVIAIIGVLACILVPSMSKYIRRSQKAVDVTNAKQIYQAVELVLALDDDACDSFYKYNTGKWSRDGVQYLTVAKLNGTSNPQGGGAGSYYIWQPGNNEGKAFTDALNESMGFELTSNNSRQAAKVKMKCNSHSGGIKTDRWCIVIKKNGTEREVEIWASDSSTSGAGMIPHYRLWPNPDTEYVVEHYDD